MTSGLPFDDFRALLANLPGPDEEAVAAVRRRDPFLTKPPGALGKLEGIAEWLAAWTGKHKPVVCAGFLAIAIAIALFECPQHASRNVLLSHAANSSSEI